MPSAKLWNTAPATQRRTKHWPGSSYRAGRVSEAAEIYRKWLACDPDNPIPKHMLAASTGENVPTRAGDAYLSEIFDAFADSFDENLHELGYRAPELLAAAVATKLGARVELSQVAWIFSMRAAERGCADRCSGPMAGTLVGVDISPGMLDKARARGMCDELIVEELSTFMRRRPASVDVIVSADTLVYFGALEEPLAAAYACLRNGGLQQFTLERLDPSGCPGLSNRTSWTLQPSGVAMTGGAG